MFRGQYRWHMIVTHHNPIKPLIKRFWDTISFSFSFSSLTSQFDQRNLPLNASASFEAANQTENEPASSMGQHVRAN